MNPNIKDCRSCGAPIVWIDTTSGKFMPCDAYPVYYKMTGEGKDKIVTPEGVVVAGTITADPKEATGRGYIPHWSTCNDPDKFRKKGGHKNGI